MSRYPKDAINWLLEEVKNGTADGRATAKDVCALLMDEWNKKTGGHLDADGILSAFYRLRARQMPALSQDSVETELRPGEVVAIQKTGDAFAKFVPTMEDALRMVNGGVRDYKFYACRELIVEYRTIVVVKGKV